MIDRKEAYSPTDSNLIQRVWKTVTEYAGLKLWGTASPRWRLHEFRSEKEAIREPLLSGIPVLFVLAVRGCRYCEFTRRLFERSVNVPVLPNERQQATSKDAWLIGDSVQVVWVDCGRSPEAEAFCEARQPRTVPYVELAFPLATEESFAERGYNTVEFSRETWDWSVIGLRAFLRACGVLPPPGLPPWLYERWQQTRRTRTYEPSRQNDDGPVLAPGHSKDSRLSDADETHQTVP
ncbi:hypothetical protein CCYA_CCYA03G0921 [Cyanidiococcus yangmingshanensis]|uniref:Uncharacterized protein n=1 Tax=Cyanidiococcus yangmingshanensis TaxID=2690220 RepID=A0A7J7IP66_9RHOD|nr:hypothetical protein F1559_004294 [Cyanidiococcus yangmingshanensis]KAK4530064.1 hypothetical protein CCYA_CCYA03G0921 [Cyanidiococcus yangmingshanensis]